MIASNRVLLQLITGTRTTPGRSGSGYGWPTLLNSSTSRLNSSTGYARRPPPSPTGKRAQRLDARHGIDLRARARPRDRRHLTRHDAPLAFPFVERAGAHAERAGRLA